MESNNLSTSIEVTPEVTTPAELSPVEQKKVEEIAKSIDISNSQFVLEYGVSAQSGIANFADQILNQVRAKDSGYVGEVLTDLVIKVKDLNVDSLSTGKNNLLGRIPFLGSLINAAQRFMTKYQKLSVEIERIIDELDKAKMQLFKDITMLDGLFQKNYEFFKEIDYFILAGNIKLKELQEKVIPEAETKAESSKDPIDAQRLNDLTQLVNRFEKKLHDLKLSRTIAIQTAPQIRLIQNNNQVLVEKIQSSILNTIPLWKNQIVIAISLLRQKKALTLQKEVSNTTNELLLKNSEMLKDSSIKIAKESERGIVEIETLKKVNDDLITTLEETIKIQEEGRIKRQQAETELKNIEQELRDKLATIRR